MSTHKGALKFNELLCCPICGATEYQGRSGKRKQIVVYKAQYGNAGEASVAPLYENEYDGKAYCGNCNKFIGNIYSNTVSKEAERAAKLITATA